ncbi:hypothetical protein LMG29542_07406 [Paraburkholderia humisilvae]|uniref:Uncharacterized protein n=1 Tax=Paraburkholderia humisilvae TaxID=627669 RepID=A0A6J5F4K0_9BURK|nr:hypothetical protein LMG29542_07406 [Paraburkholderia humisilvae]
MKKLHRITKIGESPEQSMDGFLRVMAGEVISAEVRVFNTVAKHVPRGGEHGSSDSHYGLSCIASCLNPYELGVQVGVLGPHRSPCGDHQCGLNQVPLLRTRVLRRLPALSSLRGHKPAHDTR